MNLIDVHTHTVLSSHAYSTLIENAKYAKEIGLKYLGVSDHGPALPGGQHIFAVNNMRVIPDYIEGVRVLKGVEANIVDQDGNLDIKENSLKRLNYTIASLHVPVIKPVLTIAEVTQIYLKVCDNPLVTVLGHIGDQRFKCDYKAVVKKAKASHTLIELNNSSLMESSSRVDCYQNMYEVLTLCKEYACPIIINSDAHICYSISQFAKAEALLKEVAFPKELIVNYHESMIQDYFFSER